MFSRQTWLPGVSLVAIALLALVGLFQAPALDVDMDAQVALVLVVVLLSIAVVGVLVARFVVLPLSLTGQRRDEAVTAGYAFAVAPAVYGLMSALLTSQGVLVLPFALVAAWGFTVVRSYLRRAELPR